MLKFDDFSDERNRSFCPFCGGVQFNQDHVPARVFLDKPYPDHPPYVEACLSCNQGASLDEEYAACFIECALIGSTDPDELKRDKIAKTLRKRPVLREMIEASRYESNERVFFKPDIERFKKVAVKLARGHSSYEMGLPQLDEPTDVSLFPITEMNDSDRALFETAPETHLWPEVGSRAMQRIVEGDPNFEDGWIIVQPGRYRYMALPSHAEIRMVFSEYIGGFVSWAE